VKVVIGVWQADWMAMDIIPAEWTYLIWWFIISVEEQPMWGSPSKFCQQLF
jgi:hypothetical protein